MGNALPLKVLLVAEGSGGHLIPALQVAETLAQTGAHIKVWYAQRPQTARLARALTDDTETPRVEVDAIPVAATRNPLRRISQCGRLWSQSQSCFETFAPDVVVGFGGWVSAPVLLAACLRPVTLCFAKRSRRGRQARRRRISCLLHEQNVQLGLTNRLLARWVDRVAVSFHETQASLHGTPSVVTGMPIRASISASAGHAGSRFGFDVRRPTVLVLGGSQGSRTINHLVARMVSQLTPEERRAWQFVHVTGVADEAEVREAYARHQVAAWAAPFLVEMEAAYAEADVVVARAGASTIAELASCGTPAILIPYPYAGGHQLANARLVEERGGAVVIEEREASAERVLGSLRHLLNDPRLRAMMGAQMRGLAMPHATERLTHAIIDLCAAAPAEGH